MLYVLAHAIIIKLTRRLELGEGGFAEGWIKGGEIGEGGCDGIILCLRPNRETFSVTVPPAVALLNYWTTL
jgi:hypothetical protein